MNFIFDKLRKFLSGQRKLEHLTEPCTILSYFGRFPYPEGADTVRELSMFILSSTASSLSYPDRKKKSILLASSRTCMSVCLHRLFLVAVNNTGFEFHYQLANFCKCLFLLLAKSILDLYLLSKKFLKFMFFIKLLGQREK